MTQSALATHNSPLATQSREQMKIVIVGHVDHGKSSLIGRLFYETDSLPEGKFETIKASCEKRGMPFEWSFLLDALQAERDQGITIDTTQIWFKTPKRDYVIIDAPGHKEFLKNMISGAASADAAILLIDAKEGVREQSKRHGYLLHLLGIRQIAVAVNKMDLVDYDMDHFNAIKDEYTAYLRSVGVEPTVFIPVSAREGIGVTSYELRDASGQQHSPQLATRNPQLPTILEALDAFTTTPPLTHLPLRFPVQDVYKFDERRILAGRIESGSLKVGDELLFSPSNKTTRVASIERWPDEADARPTSASAGQSVGITLADQLFIERGEIISHLADAPLLSNRFKARIVWLGNNPLRPGVAYKVKLQNAEFPAEVISIDSVLDVEGLADEPKSSNSDHPKTNASASQKASPLVAQSALDASRRPEGQSGSESTISIERHGVGEVTFRVRGLAALDDHATNARTGRFVIVEGYDVVGGGIISLDGVEDQRTSRIDTKSDNLTRVQHEVSLEQRINTNGHLPGVLWFTGLSGAGKSTIAQELQKRLFAKGYQVSVLDGDNVRHGLNRDLGFSADDRAENIRRVGEVAALFARNGAIVITAFISPYTEDRRRARAALPEYFHTVHIKAPLEVCEERDAKGLYAKARAGEILNFTGIDDPYEAPTNADLIIDTSQLSIEESVAKLADYVETHLVQPVRNAGSQIIAGEGI